MTRQQTIELICSIYDELAPPAPGDASVNGSTRCWEADWIR